MKIITIDGPGGAGKSTVAKKLALILGYLYLDTGAMYRAVALYVLLKGKSCKDEKAVTSLLCEIDIMHENNKIYLNGKDVESEIRDPEISEAASAVSTFYEVRKKMVELQRRVFHGKGLVCEGRDMGSVVFPDARYKFYLTASIEERAKRRLRDLEKMRVTASISETIQKLDKRDRQDSERAISPLVVPEGALVIDTTWMNVQEVTEKILSCVDH